MESDYCTCAECEECNVWRVQCGGCSVEGAVWRVQVCGGCSVESASVEDASVESASVEGAVLVIKFLLGR